MLAHLSLLLLVASISSSSRFTPSKCLRPHCRHQLGDVGWQPSKLELEAQLGASRERQAELEWRLAAMETVLKQHSTLLAPAAPAVPLGSLLDAIDDGHVSPPRSKVCSGGGG